MPGLQIFGHYISMKYFGFFILVWSIAAFFPNSNLLESESSARALAYSGVRARARRKHLVHNFPNHWFSTWGLDTMINAIYSYIFLMIMTISITWLWSLSARQSRRWKWRANRLFKRVGSFFSNESYEVIAKYKSNLVSIDNTTTVTVFKRLYELDGLYLQMLHSSHVLNIFKSCTSELT